MTAETQKCEYRAMCERYVQSLNIAGTEHFNHSLSRSLQGLKYGVKALVL